MTAAFAFNCPGVHQRPEARAVERRRHRHQPQFGAKCRLRIKCQREAEIAVEAALMHLVEQHRRNARQLRIGLDAVAEDAFGEDENARTGRALAVEPGRIADRLAHPLARQFGHPLGCGARGKATG